MVLGLAERRPDGPRGGAGAGGAALAPVAPDTVVVAEGRGGRAAVGARPGSSFPANDGYRPLGRHGRAGCLAQAGICNQLLGAGMGGSEYCVAG